ncbi:glycosyltransferase [Labedaea rhizosphaerae]|uniref:Glycosyl transferase family 2 n=1 Tax=Labedaea rhizosphaerae TaxID=598644 RepID=A0A4R6SGA3_LABRH|nr:glycosyltransferase [Labedaea rhizosphaerae]TDQ00735.1 glycosyl transferase family 2 [Labedaea rhizosphaerae]
MIATGGIAAVGVAAVGVVVPARDERPRIGACLRSVTRALRSSALRGVVCVVPDRCADDTEALVRNEFPDVLVVGNDLPLRLGEVRALGMRAVLADLGAVDPAAVWLLNTDADSVVGTDWVTGHVAHADAGLDAVAGLVRLTGTGHLRPATLRRYREQVAAGIRPLDHDHVYGANLGVRASAYLSVGGYAPLDTGEDRDLWRRLAAAGRRVAQPTDPVVRTSARLDGRAVGGLASLLGDLDAGP